MENRRTLLGVIGDLLFPIVCLGCEKKEGNWVCHDCRTAIPCVGVLCCPICHRETPYGLPCATCRPRSSLDRLVAVTPYHHTWIIGRVIETWKYAFASSLSTVPTDMIDRFFRLTPDIVGAPDIVVPVPLHGRRFAERGFNQAEILGRAVAEKCTLPFRHLLVRRRYTSQQARLNREERIANVEGAFACTSDSLLGKQVVLVDDVYTTGSTMQECARVLKGAGATSIVGFVVARG